MPLSVGGWLLAMVMASPALRGDTYQMHVWITGRAGPLFIATVAGAVRRLESPSCQRVLTDFADGGGHSLADSLAATGLTMPAYVSRLYAMDGEPGRACASGGTAAFTAPASHVIYVCARRFEAVFADRTASEVLVIHEILHTLGLGENPPTSRQISEQIRMRCSTPS
jgi:hypothetical protein